MSADRAVLVLQCLPLALVLLLVAIVPQWAHAFWASEKKRFAALLVPMAFAGMLTLLTGDGDLAPLIESIKEWLQFMALVASLFVIGGTMGLVGTFEATALRNVLVLALGTCLASVLGTTGASMLLIRPLIKANQHRIGHAHVIVFFIFCVGNAGGLLLPLGDPPLFMGYLKGVPFFFTLGLWPMWLTANALILLMFWFVDRWHFTRFGAPHTHTPKALPNTPAYFVGWLSACALVGVVAVVASSAALPLPLFVREGVLLALAAASFYGSAATQRTALGFTWPPIVEVATVFLAIFVAMPQALNALVAIAPTLPLTTAQAYFWTTGCVSAVLDNAPCYVSMATLAAARLDTTHVVTRLHSLACGDPEAQQILYAISGGAVLLGAMTYIGNGPNLLVRAVALDMGAQTPSFARYSLWAMVVLLPIYALAALAQGL